jgi:hypothetical protein
MTSTKWHSHRLPIAIGDSFRRIDRVDPFIIGTVLTFFALTYAVTWACFFGAAAASSGSASLREPSALYTGLLLLGTFQDTKTTASLFRLS